MNTALKENLLCIFICVMKRIPLIIVGSPGSSKSLACRIISDNLRDSF
jgi:ABC-type polysaccharide/polyol phosphate transport system ATPase subunit